MQPFQDWLPLYHQLQTKKQTIIQVDNGRKVELASGGRKSIHIILQRIKKGNV